MFRKLLTYCLLCSLISLSSYSTGAQNQNKFEIQNLDKLIELGNHFLIEQSKAYTGSVEVTMGNIDKRLKLHACLDPQAFLSPGSKAWGKITLGIRCANPQVWTIYVQANVKIKGHYYVSARALSQGQLMGETELIKMHGELSELPSNAITHPDQVQGKTLLFSINSGQTLRSDMLKSPLIIQQGQTIKLIYQGNGFQVSNEAIALNNATQGQAVRARANNGNIISGIAKNQGVVEVQ
jgi:flagella basal body P-ring formation protein FlgA